MEFGLILIAMNLTAAWWQLHDIKIELRRRNQIEESRGKAKNK